MIPIKICVALILLLLGHPIGALIIFFIPKIKIEVK